MSSRTSTTNYGLVKPSETDFFSIKDFNGNADIVDGVLGELQTFIDEINERNVGLEDVNIYVDADLGDDTNDGSQQTPVGTVSKAVEISQKYNGNQPIYIYIEDGVYNEDITILNSHNLIYFIGSGVNTIINGKFSFTSLNMCYVGNLTVNVQNSIDDAFKFFGVIYGYIENVIINHKSYNTANSGAGVHSRSSKVLFRSSTVKNAKRGFFSVHSGEIQAFTSTIDNINSIGVIQLAGTIILSSCTKGVYSTLVEIGAGGVFMDDTYVSMKTANYIN